jgi:hypothetical protein
MSDGFLPIREVAIPGRIRRRTLTPRRSRPARAGAVAASNEPTLHCSPVANSSPALWTCAVVAASAATILPSAIGHEAAHSGLLQPLTTASHRSADLAPAYPYRTTFRQADPYLPLMGVRFAALGPAACIGRLSLTDERG